MTPPALLDIALQILGRTIAHTFQTMGEQERVWTLLTWPAKGEERARYVTAAERSHLPMMLRNLADAIEREGPEFLPPPRGKQ